VTDIHKFMETLGRIVREGAIVVQELVAARRIRDPVDALSPCEREVLTLMAEGRRSLELMRARVADHELRSPSIGPAGDSR
jgi:hypothetical protein